MEWIAHCGCRLTLDDAGEPTDFLRRCEFHPDAEPADIAAENRAMSLATKAISEAAHVDPSEVLVSIVGADRHAHAEGPGGISVDFAKVTLAQYLAQHAEAVSRVRRA